MKDPESDTETREILLDTIYLVARLVDGKVEIRREERLSKGAPQHRFEFELDDQTGLNVRFRALSNGMLDVKDNSLDCPPPPGMSTNQIVGVSRMDDKRAGFSDKNDNRNGPMPVSYQLNFECNDSSMHPIAYDPIIINGGQ